MKKLLHLPAIGALALILAGCMPDLPTPLGTAIIDVTPAEATSEGWSWRISGEAAGMQFEYPDEEPATCIPTAGVSCFMDAPTEVTVRMGTDWTLVFEPYTPEGDTPVWTGTGPATELDGEAVNTAAVVHFEVPAMGSEADVSVELRRTHELQAQAAYSPPGEPASLTLNGVIVGSTGADFEVVALEAACFTQTGGIRTTSFALTGGLSVSGDPQAVSLARTGGQPSFNDAGIVCTYSGHDGENRPLSFHVTPTDD